MSKSTTDRAGETALDQALALGALGFKIVPIPVGEKFPKGLPRWQERATNDELQITEWWGHGERGIGWAMGRQPNGSNLVAIDVDVADGKNGKQNIEGYIKTLGLGKAFGSTVISRTGTGGYHFVFSLPDDVEVTNGRLLQHVDVRGEGGFIVVPPSIHPNGQPYRWATSKSPFDLTPKAAPQRLIVDLVGGAEEAGTASVGPAPSNTGTSTNDPITWANANIQPEQQLAAAGWQYSHQRGDDAFWVRPGKNIRDGHSAVVHDDGTVVVWTTELPGGWEQLGKQARDGSVILTPFDVFCAVQFNCDVREAMRYIRKELMPPEGRVRDPRHEGGPSGGTSTGEVQTSMNLPEEFWTSRPVLEHIRQAAWARLCAPEAVLGSVLSRFAAMIPPTVKIPAMVGSAATFDLITCVVASSSGGKSISNDIAAELLPSSNEKIKLDQPIGSGEGIVQAFMGYDRDESGKRVGDPSYKFGDTHSLHFTVDEGTALLEQQSRKGTTIVQTLASAWSGKTLGQLNASEDTRRLVPGGKRRVAATINMQTANGHLLWEKASIGLVSRIFFVTAHGDLPDDDITWPGKLPVAWPTGWGLIADTYLEYPSQVHKAVRTARRDVAAGRVVLSDEEGHELLVRVKLAGVLALLDGRDAVDDSDWALSATLIASSNAVRENLKLVKLERDRRHSEAAAIGRGMSDAAAEQAKERKMLANYRDRIVGWAEAAGDEGASKRDLKKRIKFEYRPLFDEALQMAVDDQRVREGDGKVYWIG